MLAKQVYPFEEFIAREHDRKRLNLRLKPLGRGKTLRLIPEFEFKFIEASCCGMAGHFGLEAEHADISLTMAEQDLLPALRAAPQDTTILANDFSCRHQIKEGSDRSAAHAAVLLREALA